MALGGGMQTESGCWFFSMSSISSRLNHRASSISFASTFKFKFGISSVNQCGVLANAYFDFIRHGICQTTNHYVAWERPWLARVKNDVVREDATLFEHFASHGLFDRLADFEKAGQTAEHICRKVFLATQQKTGFLAVYD
jgi:hypothetical protein